MKHLLQQQKIGWNISGWWQLKYFLECSSRKLGFHDPIWRFAYFFRWLGAFNHQLESCKTPFFSSTRCFTAISGLGHKGTCRLPATKYRGCFWMKSVLSSLKQLETLWNFWKWSQFGITFFLRKDVYTFSTFYMMLFESLIHIIKQIHLSNLYVETKNGKKKTPPFPPRLATSLAGASFNAWNLMVLMVRQRFLGGVLAGGFKYFLFSPLLGDDFQLD